MHLLATPPAKALAITGTLGVLAGALLREPISMIYMGSILVGVAMARAWSALAIDRARRHGLEMYIAGDLRRLSVTRGERFAFTAVIRNRSAIDLRLDGIQLITSPELESELETKQFILSGNSEANVVFMITALRLGYGTVHGLQLRASQTTGAFQAPLLFINPVQVVVWPAPLRLPGLRSFGGRGRHHAASERTSRRSGDSLELRELRTYQSGDALRKIAWKASAKRGQLLVRDEELPERQTIWVLLDSSMELWAGRVGAAPLDDAVDRVAALVQAHLRHGDRVGVAVVASRVLAWTSPDNGPKQRALVMRTLLCSSQQWDADRSGSDENHVVGSVYDHLHRLEPTLAYPVTDSQVDELAALGQSTLQRYGFEVPNVFASSGRDLALRQYAAALGLVPLSRLEAERAACDERLLDALERCLEDKPMRVVLCTPEPSQRLLAGIQRLRPRLAQRRVKLSLLKIDETAGLPLGPGSTHRIIADSIRWRHDALTLRNRTALKRLHIGLEASITNARIDQPRGSE